MAKKRKAGGRYGATKDTAVENSKLAISTYEDVADSEDEFHINRDKILLDDGPAAKRMRKWREEDQFLEPSDEEVLDYRGLEDDDGDEEEDDEDEEAEDGDDDQQFEEASAKGNPQDEDEDVGGWGPSKKDYYDADAIETEQDALDEEAEARRIQKKQLAAMNEADFGFDEDEWLGNSGEQAADGGQIVTEILPQLQITDSMTEEEKLKILKTRYPEFNFIAKEFLRLQPLHDELAATANAAQRLIKSRTSKSGKTKGELQPMPMAVAKYQACAAYLAAMSMYFAMLGSTAQEDGPPVVAMDPAELHEHPVMESLLTCQKLWEKVENLPVADPLIDTPNNDELSVIEEASSGLDTAPKPDAPKPKPKKSKRTTSNPGPDATTSSARAQAAALRALKLRQTDAELSALTAHLTSSAPKPKKPQQPGPAPARPKRLNLLDADDSDFGEETTFTAHDLAEKARKKKSLRFYTSQIAHKANRRDAAGRDYGGDADIPHRERLKDRQARLQALAEKKGLRPDRGPGVPLGEGGESDDDEGGDADAGPRAETRGARLGDDADDDDDDDGYYDLVAARSAAKKAGKLERAAAYALAAEQGGTVVEEEVVGEDGRRQISYAISKNKGLTPHRAKTNRNPRVKKKLKYEAKKKKLRSMRPVFDAAKRASGAASYGGEMTGIKKGLVRSRKL